MKNTPKKILCTLLAAVTMLSLTAVRVSAHEDNEEETTQSQSESPELFEGDIFSDEAFTYNKANGGVYITSCNSNTTSINILGSIDGYKILGVYDNAFSGCTQLRSVTIADEVGYIGKSAFLSCEKLETVKLPSGITTIPEQCFAKCTNLKNIEIPDTVTSIGSYAFSYCDNLSELKIPSSVTEIADYAFAFSTMAENIQIQEGVKTIGYMAFYYTNGIKTVSLPSTVETIGTLAFAGCSSLESFEVAEGNQSFKASGGILYSNDSTILECFPMGKNTVEFTIPDTVKFIPSGAFFDNPYVEKINMPDSVEAIGEGAFSNCTALRHINLSQKLTEIGDSVFCDCSSLKDIEIPASVSTIGNYAFLECTSLKSITVPDTVTSIGDYALGFTDDDEGKFHKLDGFEIRANFETAAKDYAKKNHVSIDYLDGNKDLPYIIAVVCVVAVIVIGITVSVIIVIRKKKKTDEFYQK